MPIYSLQCRANRERAEAFLSALIKQIMHDFAVLCGEIDALIAGYGRV